MGNITQGLFHRSGSVQSSLGVVGKLACVFLCFHRPYGLSARGRDDEMSSSLSPSTVLQLGPPRLHMCAVTGEME